MSSAACTIISNNYLAQARVLVRSHRAHHPDTPFFVCVVDGYAPSVDYTSLGATVLWAENLDIPSFRSLALRCEQMELSTAVKPYLLSHLRDHFAVDRAQYLDPDMLVLDHFSEIGAALATNQAVLTPHITAPLEDEWHPRELDLLLAGVYNLGFLALRLDASTRPFLEWWQRRLLRFCRSDPERGLFVDQRWMDFAPSFLDRALVLRSPRYNVAYWNLSQRDVHRADHRWMVGEEPLALFHFSGLDPFHLESVSRHQNRFRLSDLPSVQALFEEYRRLLLAAGLEETRALPYRYGAFDGTVPVPTSARRLLAAVDPLGVRWPDPFDPEGEDSYLRWLVEPLRFERGTLNRAVVALWELRADLIRAFPRVCGEDLPRYVAWLRGGEAERAGLHPIFTTDLASRPEGERNGRHVAIAPRTNGSLRATKELLRFVDLAQPRDHADWLNQPVAGSALRPTITHLALLLYEERPDVQSLFPDPLGKDQARFATWFVRSAATEFGLHPDLVRTTRESLRWRGRLAARLRRRRPPAAAPRHAVTSFAAGPGADRRRRPPFGVNLAGYFSHPTGIGQISRAHLAALQDREAPVAAVWLSHQGHWEDAAGAAVTPAGLPFEVTVLQANADQTPTALSRLPAAACAGAALIGYWFWELSHFPLSYAGACELVDEIWAPSRFCADSFATLASCPVRVVAPHVPAPRMAAPAREQFGLDPRRFYFLSSLDARSVVERKNPRAAIEALRRLLDRTRHRAGLVLAINHATEAPDAVAQLRQETNDLPVVLITETLSRARLDSLFASCDGLVSLHRSEGLGLLPIEFLHLGKPVVATAYGGVTDFFDDDVGFPVGFRLVRVERQAWPYPPGAVWADADVEQAVAAMHQVIDDRHEAVRRAQRGQSRVNQIYGIEAAGARLLAELTRVWSGFAAPR